MAMRRKNPTLKIVWDPVLCASSGGTLLDAAGFKLALQRLLPLADLVTPNALEMARLLGEEGRRVSPPEVACRFFFERLGRPIYLKGGHLRGRSRDYFFDGSRLVALTGRRSFRTLRGTGCWLATAIACELARGRTLLAAARRGKGVMNRAFAGGVRGVRQKRVPSTAMQQRPDGS
jgi:hydroxymethylpyrimidine kinase/phosphomethylpyrimidine kinase